MQLVCQPLLAELGVDPSEEDIFQMAEGTIDARGGDHAGNLCRKQQMFNRF